MSIYPALLSKFAVLLSLCFDNKFTYALLLLFHHETRYMQTKLNKTQLLQSSPYKTQQAGTGPSRRHIQGSKIAKGLPSVNLQYSKIEKANTKGPSGAPGPASASPWRAKRGTLPKLSTFLSQLKGGPFGEETNFREKSHNAEKLKGGPFGIFKHPNCCKISKKLKRGPFGEKKN